MGSDRLPTIVGFAGALIVLAILVWVVGLGDVVAALERARPPILGLVVLVAGVWLTAWGLALKTVLGTLDAPISSRSAVLVYAAAVFSNNVTPFGQAGGEPVSALLISKASDSEYQTGLAAIASVDALHFFPSIGFAIVGLAVAALGTVPLGRNLALAATAVGVLAVAVPTSAVLAWRYRYRIEAIVVRVMTPVVQRIAGVLPNRPVPGADVVGERIEGFFHAVERVATDRSALLTALSLSAIGWLAKMASLWLSLYALGETVPVAAVLLAVPVAGIAAVTPLPGGSGALETVLAAVLVPTAGVTPALATSAVLIHRGATYWLPTLVGGGVASALGADRSRIEH